MDLLSFVPLRELGSTGDGNDIWGWTDPETEKEYAIVGCQDGTSFVDVTEPKEPVVLAFLRTHTSSSLWRDLKVKHFSLHSNSRIIIIFLQLIRFMGIMYLLVVRLVIMACKSLILLDYEILDHHHQHQK